MLLVAVFLHVNIDSELSSDKLYSYQYSLDVFTKEG